MKSYFYHIQFNIDYKNIQFYKELMAFLGWNTLYEGDDVLGVASGDRQSLWFLPAKKNEQTDYDKIGGNHISIRVENQKDVDEVTSYLKSKNVTPLFETPRHRSEFAANEKETYYQVMFESPDKILFEVVYTGIKQ